MSKTQYTYAVARIRALEVSLFSASVIEQLLACRDYDSCLRFLQEKGWGGDAAPDADRILAREEQKSGRLCERCTLICRFSMYYIIRTGFTI